MLIFQSNDAPIEADLLMQMFDKWQAQTVIDLSRIVVHGLRHSSTNLKRVISDGDLKAIQGDFGWSSLHMIEHSGVMYQIPALSASVQQTMNTPYNSHKEPARLYGNLSVRLGNHHRDSAGTSEYVDALQNLHASHN